MTEVPTGWSAAITSVFQTILKVLGMQTDAAAKDDKAKQDAVNAVAGKTKPPKKG